MQETIKILQLGKLKMELKIRLFKKVVTIEEVKNGKKLKRSFDTFYTKMKLVKSGEEDKGIQEVWVNVKFRKEVDTKNLKSGYLVVDSKQLNAPFKYEIKKDEDGNNVYPEVWVREIKKFIPIEVNHQQNEFVTEEDVTTEEYQDSNS